MELLPLPMPGGRALAPHYAGCPIFGDVQLGLHATTEEYLEEIARVGDKIYGSVRSIQKGIPCLGQKRTIRLVLVSAKGLGFTGYTKYKDICTQAISLGFSLCPAEVALAMRLAYRSQPFGGYIHIAMEAIKWKMIYGTIWEILAVSHLSDHRLWLMSNAGEGEKEWPEDRIFVFACPMLEDRLKWLSEQAQEAQI